MINEDLLKKIFPLSEEFSLGKNHFHYQEILKFLAPFISQDRKEKIDQVIENRTFSVLPILENIYDEGNIFAALRSSESFGYQGLHIIKSKKTKQRSIDSRLLLDLEQIRNRGAATGKKSARGCEKWVHIERWEETKILTHKLKSLGYLIGVSTLDESDKNLPLAEFPLHRPMAIIFGNEKSGVDPQTIKEADFTFKIPMCGFSQSLNLSVAMGLVLYQLYQRRINEFSKQGDLLSQQKEILKSHFYLKSCHRPDQLLNHLKFNHSQKR